MTTIKIFHNLMKDNKELFEKDEGKRMLQAWKKELNKEIYDKEGDRLLIESSDRNYEKDGSDYLVGLAGSDLLKEAERKSLDEKIGEELLNRFGGGKRKKKKKKKKKNTQRRNKSRRNKSKKNK